MRTAVRSAASPTAPGASFRDAAIAGLSQQAKSIPSRFLYDRRGCELFDEITRLEEYYPTRIEMQLLAEHAREIVGDVGPRATVVEFGAGTADKARIILDRLPRPTTYIPIDVAGDALARIASGPLADENGLTVRPEIGDFTEGIRLPKLDRTRPRLGLFFGSTIGNLHPRDALTFLERVSTDLGPGALFLVGVDTRKAERTLVRAYDDAHGTTASFNMNLLRRANLEIGADFNLNAFEHQSRWNDTESRIEMHLLSRRAQTVHIGDQEFTVDRGETIHTENSYKYGAREFELLARCSGWTPRAAWTDAGCLYSLHLLAN